MLALALVVAAVVGLGAQTSYGDEVGRVHRVFTMKSDEITESSSLAVSTVHRRLVYTTNDSGDSATIYVLDDTNGSVVGRTTLSGVEAVDIEAIAVGSDGALVVADIGDNDAMRDSVRIYRLDQPGTGDQTAAVETVTLTYADGPRDAESVLYDAESGRVSVVSKELGGAAVYSTPRYVFDRDRSVLHEVASAPPVATDATFLPGDELAVIRTYVGASVYRYPGWKRVRSFDLPRQEQGESIAAPPRGDEVWVGTEGERSEVLAVRLPPIPEPGQPSSSPETDGTSGASPGGTADGGASGDDSMSRGIAEIVLISAGAGLALLVVVGLALARRHRH